VLALLSISSVATALAIVLGLLVGSFLNVVIMRIPARLMHSWRQQSREILGIVEPSDESPPPGIVFEPSHCPKCKHKLGALENIPVISWLMLRGRCKHCHTPISAQYPLVEAITAIASACVVAEFGLTWAGGSGLVLTWMLIALAGIDLRTQLLPDQITLPLLWLGLLLSLQQIWTSPTLAIWGAVCGYLSLWSVYWMFKLITGKEGMGYGDFKLLGALGAWFGLGCVLPIVLISSVLGALVGGAYLALRDKSRATPIPFGPFIAAAGWVCMIGANALKEWFGVFFSFAN
jgi:leader peptidase (prepilin peptidase)/N-methyltransferase